MTINKTIRYSCVFLIILAWLSVFISSCTIEGYRHFKTPQGIAHFSFEYPHGWRIRLIEYRDNYTSLTMSAPYIIVDGEKTKSTSVMFFIYPPNDKYPDAKAAFNDRLDFYKSTYNEYTPLNRSVAKVGIVTGEQIKFSYRTPIEGFVDDPIGGDVPEIAQFIAFDHLGLIWTIWISSHQEIAVAHNSYFKRLLDTFQFLE